MTIVASGMFDGMPKAYVMPMPFGWKGEIHGRWREQKTALGMTPPSLRVAAWNVAKRSHLESIHVLVFMIGNRKVALNPN